MTGDRIELRGLRAFGRHGVYDHERADGQEFVVDVRLELSLESALRSDAVTDTVHYGELAERVSDIVAGEPADLIETVAGRIADAVLEDPRVDEASVTVHKPSAPIAVAFGDVSVTVSRRHENIAVLSLGSNLGDRTGLLESAIEAISRLPSVSITRKSPVVESSAVTLEGVDDEKPAYLNQVLIVRTGRGPLDLLQALQSIESDHGRVRQERWGNRTLDLDIIDYNHAQMNLPGLELPHPRAVERAFVLVPWASADPDAVLLGHGSVAERAAAIADQVTVVRE